MEALRNSSPQWLKLGIHIMNFKKERKMEEEASTGRTSVFLGEQQEIRM